MASAIFMLVYNCAVIGGVVRCNTHRIFYKYMSPFVFCLFCEHFTIECASGYISIFFDGLLDIGWLALHPTSHTGGEWASL